MFNPFYPFTAALLQAFAEKGKRWFVRQSFPRGMDPLNKAAKKSFLISPYDNYTTAQDHLGAIAYDPHRFFYDWEDEDHRKRLQMAAAGLPEWPVFAPVLRPGWEKGLTEDLRKKIRIYIGNLGWKPGGSEVVETAYEVRFGELYCCLKYKRREVKVKFEAIETCC